jgi:hypothetical protein
MMLEVRPLNRSIMPLVCEVLWPLSGAAANAGVRTGAETAIELRVCSSKRRIGSPYVFRCMKAWLYFIVKRQCCWLCFRFSDRILP